MSGDDGFGFAPPPFNAEASLVQIKRALRDLRMGERGNGFELKGRRAIELALEDGAIAVRLAKRLAVSPEWDRQIVKSGADQRKLLDEVKRRLERWQRED